METFTLILGIIVTVFFLIFGLAQLSYAGKRMKIRDDSKYVKELDDINKKYEFEVVSKTINLNKVFYNVVSYRNFNPDVYLAEYLIENSKVFMDILNNEKMQEKEYSKYLAEYNAVVSNAKQEDAERIRVPYSEYLSYEKAYFQAKLKKIRINLNFKITWTVENSQSKGKSRKKYTFQDAKDIFYAYYKQDLDSGFNSLHYDFVKRERALLTDSLRYDILRRDGFRCQICGATARDGVKLHIDHIIPVSKGGKTEPQNLRTLCDRCNFGKSDKIE